MQMGDTHVKREGGRHGRDVAVSQGLAAATQGRKEAGRSLPQGAGEHSLADAPTSDFQPLEPGQSKSRWFEAPGAWCGQL